MGEERPPMWIIMDGPQGVFDLLRFRWKANLPTRFAPTVMLRKAAIAD